MKEKVEKKVSKPIIENVEIKREILDTDHIVITYEDGTTKIILV